MPNNIVSFLGMTGLSAALVVSVPAHALAAVLNPVLPTIVSLPAAPTRLQIQVLARQALAAQLQTGLSPEQALAPAAITLAGQLNAPNMLQPGGGTLSPTQILPTVALAAAKLPGITPAQVQAFLTIAVPVQPAPVAPAVNPSPVLPPAVSAPIPANVPTIASLPAALTRARIQALAVSDLISAIQAGGTPGQALSAAAQKLLGQLNAPNILQPGGGLVTLNQALAVLSQNPVAAIVQNFFAQSPASPLPTVLAAAALPAAAAAPVLAAAIPAAVVQPPAQAVTAQPSAALVVAIPTKGRGNSGGGKGK